MAEFKDNDRQLFQDLCSLTQPRLMNALARILKGHYKNIEANSTFILAKGNIPVALVAHADTVFPTPPTEFYFDSQKSIMWSPDGLGADDRAGIFAILKILQDKHLRPHVIITTDEERGCVGSAKLAMKYPKFPAEVKFLIQLDRRGENDSVFYDCTNDEFEEYVNKFGFETAWGTLSDISVLAPAWGVAAVNFSVGYQNEHSLTETLNIQHLYNTIEKVKKILYDVKHNEVPTFKYMEKPNKWASLFSGNRDKYSGYTYNPSWLGDCEICNCAADPEELMTVSWASTLEEVEMCLSCFSKICTNVIWCKECHEGWIDMEYKGDENDYECPRCKAKREREEGKVNAVNL